MNAPEIRGKILAALYVAFLWLAVVWLFHN